MRKNSKYFDITSKTRDGIQMSELLSIIVGIFGIRRKQCNISSSRSSNFFSILFRSTLAHIFVILHILS